MMNTKARHSLLVWPLVISLLTACASSIHQQVGPTPILQAEMEIPPEQLLDVGIVPFISDEMTAEAAEKEGTNPDIRAAESHFMAYHLKNTLQQSGHWGAVSVLPAAEGSTDLLIEGKILESNGEHLALKIDVVDASGKAWLSKTYRAQATEFSYRDTLPGRKDAHQDLYNAIANDIARFKATLTPDALQTIRTVSRLKFAEDLAPEPFSRYLAEDANGRLKVKRLPSEDDPMMERLLKIRGREYMYVDTLNEYYDTFYNAMWPSYEEWRKMSLTEREAMKRVKKDAAMRQVAGILMLVGAVALAAGDVNYSGPLQVGLAVVGGQVIVDGFNISKQTQIHASAIKELSESFAGEMKPIVMEFQGRQYELTGSAEEQFHKWRDLLRKIYYAETGFAPAPLTDENKDDAPD
ncbi:MAG: hypothetical protein PVG51_05680 [Desulfosarcina sp.]|jgi:hypothetical protein